MDPLQAYARWAKDYDINKNLTRDVEASALRNVLNTIDFKNCLEIGCGTGKNTEWLLTKAETIKAIDISKEMLAVARQKIQSKKLMFEEADVLKEWIFADRLYDLISFSLVLEHIEDLDPIFKKAVGCLNKGGHIYIGELHPFKQYTGSKARFENEDGVQIVNCFNHHVSDFLMTANKYNLQIMKVHEYFDEDDRTGIPRILSVLLKK